MLICRVLCKQEEVPPPRPKKKFKKLALHMFLEWFEAQTALNAQCILFTEQNLVLMVSLWFNMDEFRKVVVCLNCSITS